LPSVIDKSDSKTGKTVTFNSKDLQKEPNTNQNFKEQASKRISTKEVYKVKDVLNVKK